LYNQRLFICRPEYTVPIYEYKCTNCGFQKEYLRKVSDPAQTDCPSCGQATFSKMVTAAGFQLKGTGWYVTDFRNSGGSESATGKAAPSTKAADTASGDSTGTSAPSAPAAPAADSSASTGTSTKADSPSA
jgi:putative FmdB family regulatory protein